MTKPKRSAAVTPVDDLPNAEFEVLAFVRRRGSATTRQVSEGLERRMGISAAQALLLRLEAKGLLRRERGERHEPNRFVPTARAEPTFRKIARRLVDRVFGGRATDVVATLFDGGSIRDEDIAQLKDILDEARRRKKR